MPKCEILSEKCRLVAINFFLLTLHFNEKSKCIALLHLCSLSERGKHCIFLQPYSQQGLENKY